MKRNILVIAGGFCLLVFLALNGLAMIDSEKSVQKNAIFRNHRPDEEIYKRELAQKIIETGTDHLTFTFCGYQKSGADDLIILQVDGSSLSAAAHVKFSAADKIAWIKTTGGKGYRGAELTGLKLGVLQTDGHTDFVFRDYKEFID